MTTINNLPGTLTAPATGDLIAVRDIDEAGTNKDKQMALSSLDDLFVDLTSAQTIAGVKRFSDEARVGASSQYLGARRAGVTLTNSGFTTVLSSLTGVSLVMFQLNNNSTYYGGVLMCMLNSATLQIATVSVSNVVAGAPTGFNVGYQASGSALQLRAGPSWPATVGVNVAVLQLTW